MAPPSTPEVGDRIMNNDNQSTANQSTGNPSTANRSGASQSGPQSGGQSSAQSGGHQASANLAPVYLDNKPIALKDARPKVSAILSASGKPETTDVKWLQFQPNTQGKALRSEEVVDRTTDPTRPIYLTSTSKGGSATDAAWKGKQAAAGSASATGAAAGTQRGEKGQDDQKAWSGTDAKGADAEGMQDDAEVGGESGRTATTDE